uniref:Uncharacterized protein n=1 Tax=Oryza glumipatula TaxID=40148 RepID=A0A0E0A9H2_9ORYZ
MAATFSGDVATTRGRRDSWRGAHVSSSGGAKSESGSATSTSPLGLAMALSPLAPSTAAISTSTTIQHGATGGRGIHTSRWRRSCRPHVLVREVGGSTTAASLVVAWSPERKGDRVSALSQLGWVVSSLTYDAKVDLSHILSQGYLV